MRARRTLAVDVAEPLLVVLLSDAALRCARKHVGPDGARWRSRMARGAGERLRTAIAEGGPRIDGNFLTLDARLFEEAAAALELLALDSGVRAPIARADLGDLEDALVAAMARRKADDDPDDRRRCSGPHAVPRPRRIGHRARGTHLLPGTPGDVMTDILPIPANEGSDAQRAMRDLAKMQDDRMRRVLKGILERQIRFNDRLQRLDGELAALRRAIDDLGLRKPA